MEAYAHISRSRMRTRRALTQPLGASSFISKTIVGDSCVRAFQSSRARPTDGSDVRHAGVCDVTLPKIFRTYGAHSAAAGVSDSLLDIVADAVGRDTSTH